MNNQSISIAKWLKIAILNLCLLALTGVVLRYKINYSLPIVNHKNLLHAHSHFAFTGWVSFVLMILMVHFLQSFSVKVHYSRYRILLLLNCLAAYGMLVSFFLQGYAAYSIAFSVLSIVVSYGFVICFWRHLSQLKEVSPAIRWFKAALVLWMISSLGVFALGYLMTHQNTEQSYYFGSIYFFLHFQYNGWFLFAIFGLFFHYLDSRGYPLPSYLNRNIYWILIITVGPTYLLSVLWLGLPVALEIMTFVAPTIQLAVLIYFFRMVRVFGKKERPMWPTVTRWLWAIALWAFGLKILLQWLSALPFFAKYAFSVRPIVVAYLHLSLLGIISFFILGYINAIVHHQAFRLNRMGVWIFTIGFLMQELLLGLQGMEAMGGQGWPYVNLLLLLCALAMFLGLLLIGLTMLRKPVGIGLSDFLQDVK